jgi:hypothetical protein
MLYIVYQKSVATETNNLYHNLFGAFLEEFKENAPSSMLYYTLIAVRKQTVFLLYFTTTNGELQLTVNLVFSLIV